MAGDNFYFQNALVIIGSARRSGNTEVYIDNFFKNAQVRKVNLLDYKMFEYNYDHIYPASDQFYEITEMMIEFEKIVFVTPVYWYSMSGVMKKFFDRFTDLITIRKDKGRALAGKSIYLIAVGSDAELPEGFENPFKLTARYFEMIFEGTIYHSIKASSDQNISL